MSGPITDSLRARITGYYNKVGGHEFNVTTRSDYGGSEGFGIRGKLEWDATDTLNFLASADYRKSDAECCRSILIATTNPTLRALYSPIVPSPHSRLTAEDRPSAFSTDQQTYSLQGDLDLGGASITSITAYQIFNTENRLDIDAINNPVTIFVGSTGGSASAKYDNHGTAGLKNFTQELRISSSGNRPLTYVAGVYYSNLSLLREFDRRRAYCATGVLGQPCTATYQSIGSSARLTSDSVSAFGQAELELVGGLKAIGGLRVQYEKTAVAGTVFGPLVAGDAVFPGSTLGSGRRSASDTAITGKGGLQYQFSREAQAYASYTRGYKGLGFYTEVSAAFATQNPVQPESQRL